MSTIKDIKAYKIVNSRGNWTISTRVTLDDGSFGVQSVPEGASKGENEAISVSADQAASNVNSQIKNVLVGKDPFDQADVDDTLISLDGTNNKSNLGCNAILSVSLAVARAAASSREQELYEYLKALYGNDAELKFPTPVFNILNGGKHAQNGLSFQEFMLIPAKTMPYDKAVQAGMDVYHQLKSDLKENGFNTGVGDEGGFAPSGFTVERALSFITNAANEHYQVGDNVFLGMDVAAESFYKDGKYEISEESKVLSSEELANFYVQLVKQFAIMYLEDGFYENDKLGWKALTEAFTDKLLIVGDDLVVTNPSLLDSAIEENLANAVIVKPNQIGTLSETLEFVRKAQDNNMAVVVSHRSGETAEDTFIADLALAVGADFIKTGAPARGERVVKYNRLLEVFYSVNE